MEQTMRICVSGWYFDKELFHIFNEISEEFKIDVVVYYRRAEDKMPKTYDRISCSYMIEECKKIAPKVDFWKIPVASQEFANYDHFIKNIWDGKSRVLFMHDDIRVYNHTVFNKISRLTESAEIDQAYIFRDEKEEIANGRKHGRGIYCSKRFIRFALDYLCHCKHAYDHEHPHYIGQQIDGKKIILRGVGPHRGFFYDCWNKGIHVEGKVPFDCRHYNESIYHFSTFAGRTCRTDKMLPPNEGNWPGFNSNVKMYFADFNAARRGDWKGKIYGRGEKI